MQCTIVLLTGGSSGHTWCLGVRMAYDVKLGLYLCESYASTLNRHRGLAQECGIGRRTEMHCSGGKRVAGRVLFVFLLSPCRVEENRMHICVCVCVLFVCLLSLHAEENMRGDLVFYY